MNFNYKSINFQNHITALTLTALSLYIARTNYTSDFGNLHILVRLYAPLPSARATVAQVVMEHVVACRLRDSIFPTVLLVFLFSASLTAEPRPLATVSTLAH